MRACARTCLFLVIIGIWGEFGFECAAQGGPVGIASGEPFDMTSSMIRMLGGFLFCLGLFAAGIHLYKKFFLRTSGAVQRRLRIVERLPISQKNSLLLVELDGREVLLATGPDAPTVLVPNVRRDLTFEDSLLDLETSEGQVNAQ